MTIYLIDSFIPSYDKAFTNKQLAEEYLSNINPRATSMTTLREIELITDQFMEQILQPKESHETNTNSSLYQTSSLTNPSWLYYASV